MPYLFPLIYMGCIVRDREWILNEYLERVFNIDFPKGNIVLSFLVNDSKDKSFDIISSFKSRYGNLYAGFIVDSIKKGVIKDSRNGRVRAEIYYHLAEMRNLWVSKRIGDYVFSVDSDVLLEQDTLKRLLNANKDICSALISNDILNKDRFFNILNYSKNAVNHIIPRGSGLLKVDVTGAVYLIKSKVFDKVKYGYSIYGEDIYFCKECDKYGFEKWCDTSIRLEHRMTK